MFTKSGPGHFYNTFCKLVLTQKGENKYYFLYEGVPGGSLEKGTDYWLTSDGSKGSAGPGRGGDIPAPEWICFGDAGKDRVIFLLHYNDDSENDGLYTTPNPGLMVIFGFGRSSTSKLMSAVPDSFAVGFIESTDHNTIKTQIDGVISGVTEEKGGWSPRPSSTTGSINVQQRSSRELTLMIASKQAHTIGVYDSFGRKVLTQSGNMPGRYHLNTATLPAGLYLLRVTSGTERYAKTFVLQ